MGIKRESLTVVSVRLTILLLKRKINISIRYMLDFTGVGRL